jgi:hypothetical protein
LFEVILGVAKGEVVFIARKVIENVAIFCASKGAS